MKIKVCIPFYNEFDTCKPGLRELKGCDTHDFTIETISGTYISTSRNRGITESQKIKQEITEYDYYLFIDSDISFQLADVLRLVDADVHVICAPYKGHNSEVYQCGHLDGDKIESKFGPEMKGVHPADWCGGGFLLVKNTVFSKLTYPYFRHSVIEDGENASEIGEDIGFCINLRDNNVPLFCDFDIKIAHAPKRMSYINRDLNVIKPDPIVLIKHYYDNANQFLLEGEREKAKIYGVADSMGWNAEKINSILGIEFVPVTKG